MIISAEKGRGNKIHISVDGEYLFTTDEEFWYTCGFFTNDEISEEQLAGLRRAAEYRYAYSKALDFISRRDYCAKELFRKLRISVDAEAAEAAVERAVELGLINDEVYAQRLAEELLNQKGMSPNFIKSELLRRGVPREIAKDVVEALDIEPRERIILLLNGKYSNRLSDEKSYQKTFNALLRLGYGYSDIRSAMREVDSEITDGRDEF